MPHPGDKGGFSPLLNRDSFRAGHRAAADGCGMVGDGTGQPVGEIGVVGMEGQEIDHRSQEILDVLGLGLVSATGIGQLSFGKTAANSARMRSIVVAGAQIPREKTLRPFFSATTQ